MTFVAKTIYAIACDRDGCDERYPDDEYVGWVHKDTVTEQAEWEGWWCPSGGSHYCGAHDPRCGERCGNTNGPYGVDTDSMCPDCWREFAS